MRTICICLLIIGCALAGWAQPGAETFGMLKGTVVYDTGRPFTGKVTVQVGEKRYVLTANKDGAFQGIVAAGQAVVRAGGVEKTVTVTAGEMATVELVVRLERQVVQTACNAAGQPVPNTPMFASYCWSGRIEIVRTVTDDRGQVTWRLPTVPVITWGAGVPAGVLPLDKDTVTGPLPPPLPDGHPMPVKLTLPTPANADKVVLYRHSGAALASIGTVASSTAPVCMIEGGVPFSVMAVTLSTPPRAGWLTDVYAPYGATPQHELPLAMREGTSLTLRFTAGGAPVAGLSRLRLLPLPDDPLPLLHDAYLRVMRLLRPMEQPDGSYTVQLPAPGAYRVLPDLYDEQSPPEPALQLNVAAGQAAVTIPLPAPLLRAPAGAELCWVTREAPLRPQRLVVAAREATSPIFGAPSQLLMAWFNPSPSQLEVHTPWDAQQPRRTLTLRAVELSTQRQDGRPLAASLTLQPLLLPMDPVKDYQLQARVTCADAATAGLALPSGQRVLASLWPGTYAVSGEYGAGFVGTLEVPDAPDAKAVFMMNTSGNRPQALRDVVMTFTAIDYDAMLRQGGEQITLTTDIPFAAPSRNEMAPRNMKRDLTGESTNYASVPAAAKTLTLQWLGVGVIRDVPIPPPGDNPRQAVKLTLPAWSSPIPVEGVITERDGKPAANRPFYARQGHIRDEQKLRFTTDLQGRFSLRGVLPGPLFITNGDINNLNGWALTVPEAGLPAITLRLAARPIQVDTMGTGAFVWWLPDGGAPRLLANEGGYCGGDEPLTGKGLLWAIDGYYGTSILLPYAMAPGKFSRTNQPAPPAPSLGLLVSMGPDTPMPGAIELVGEGALAGLRAQFLSPTWRVVPLLHLALAQINAVPPGRYTVIIHTPTGPRTVPVTVTAEGGVVQLADR